MYEEDGRKRIREGKKGRKINSNRLEKGGWNWNWIQLIEMYHTYGYRIENSMNFCGFL